MTIYAVYLPDEGRPGRPEGLDKAVFVKDGFHWLALVFPLLWLLFARAWLAAIAFVVLAAAIAVAGAVFNLSDGMLTALEILMVLATAFLAADIKGWALARRGYRLADVVSAPKREEAERRFFARWMSGHAAAPTKAAAPPASPRVLAPDATRPQVLGLFPDAGGRS
jgi:hypothetical protein